MEVDSEVTRELPAKKEVQPARDKAEELDETFYKLKKAP